MNLSLYYGALLNVHGGVMVVHALCAERKQPGEDFQAKDGADRIHVLAHASVSLPPTITSLTAAAPILAISIIRDAKGRPLQVSK